MDGVKVVFQIHDRTNNKKDRRKLAFSNKSFTMGRSTKADPTITDPKMSSVHCTLKFSDLGIILKDENSSNGSYIDKERVEEDKLDIGSTFYLGTHSFVVESYELNNQLFQAGKSTPLVTPPNSTDLPPAIPANPMNTLPDSQDNIIGNQTAPTELTTNEPNIQLEVNAKNNQRRSEPKEPNPPKPEEISEGLVAFFLDNIQAFLKSPINYFDIHKYGGHSQNFYLSVLAIAAVASALESITIPVYAIFILAVYLGYNLVFAYVCDWTKNFTEIKANRLQVLHFMAVYAALSTPIVLLTIIPILGFFFLLPLLVLMILGIKGFFVAFKPKVIPMILVVIAFGFVSSIAVAPLVAFIPSPAQSTKAEQEKMNHFMKDTMKRLKDHEGRKAQTTQVPAIEFLFPFLHSLAESILQVKLIYACSVIAQCPLSLFFHNIQELIPQPLCLKNLPLYRQLCFLYRPAIQQVTWPLTLHSILFQHLWPNWRPSRWL